MKLSECFRKLQADYVKKYGVGNWELYWKLTIIYTYHEYAISAYYNCNKLYSEYQSITWKVSHTNDPEWIFAENSYHSAVFGIYTNGAILLDLLRSVNEIIRASNNKLLIDELNKVTQEFHVRVIDFKDTRNNVTAHPYEEWDNGVKVVRYVTPVSSEGSGDYLTKLVFRMFEIQKLDFSKEISINPYVDITFLNDYVERLSVIYREFFQL